MCGISGILNTRGQMPIDDCNILRMVSIIRHRGPDECGIYLDPYIAMGQVRLSIIGIDSGTQPISNEDGSLWIVYNGETFNYIELKEELIKKGHTFLTETDTEVVIHLYEEYGPECLKKINGQFAMAIWDNKKRHLFLARDRIGIRPLYFCNANGKFLFSSEIKSIFMDSDIKREIDVEALYQVFTFWTTLKQRTIFKDIQELPPGHYMVIKEGQINQERYWSIPNYPSEQMWSDSYTDAEEELKRLLKDAVRIRLRADVPVGAYLSGGLDSSFITSLISYYFNNRLRTFSMGFQEATFDESQFQKEMIQFLGTDHNQTMITNKMIGEHLPNVVWHCEKPLLRTAPVPLFLLSKLVRENQFKVVLTGEGADEIFGGYNIFKEAKVRKFWSDNPESRLRPLLLERLYPYVFKDFSRSRFFLQKFYSVRSEDLEDPLFSHRTRWNNSGKNRLFFSDHVLAEVNGYDPLGDVIEQLPPDFMKRDVLSKSQFLEMDIFLSNYLLSSQGDRVAMAHSLEIRLPYLDYRVMDFASRLPSKWKIKGLNEKYILKKIAEDFVTVGIKSRGKQPYRAPISEVFFSGKPFDYVEELLSESCLKKGNYFNEKKVNNLISKFKKADSSFSNEVQNMALVGILSTQLIHDQFIENFPYQRPILLKADKIVKN